MSGVDVSVVRVTVVLKFTLRVWSGFHQDAYEIGGVTRGTWFALRCIGDDAAAEQSLFTASKRDRL